MQKNVASQKLILFAFTPADGLPKTGDAANITPYVSKDYGAVTAITDTSASEMDATNAKGYYLVDLAQAETNADTLLFSAKSATAGVVVIASPATVFTTPASFSSDVVQTGDSFVRLGAPAGASVSADIVTLDNFIDTEMAATLAAAVAILAMLDDARAEPGQGAPPVNPDAMTKLDYIYKSWRNLKTNDGTTTKLFADDGVTVDQKQATSQAAGTVTKAEWITGP